MSAEWDRRSWQLLNDFDRHLPIPLSYTSTPTLDWTRHSKLFCRQLSDLHTTFTFVGQPIAASQSWVHTESDNFRRSECPSSWPAAIYSREKLAGRPSYRPPATISSGRGIELFQGTATCQGRQPSDDCPPLGWPSRGDTATAAARTSSHQVPYISACLAGAAFFSRLRV